MGNGFWMALWQMCQLCFWTARYLPKGGCRHLPRRTLMFGLIVPVLLAFTLLHWLGFVLDEVFFRKYRRVQVKKPVFVTGIPRSGTTHLQRVLADHDKLTAMQTWECFLAPSISERYFWLGVGRLCRPLGKLFARLPIPFLKKMQAIHSLGLTEAEEDFVTLLPINACFLLVVLFPQASRYWHLSRFDLAIAESERKRILIYYQRIIQKHLYFHGTELRYLCKNPSFMMWLRSLGQQFPDASFIVCERTADKTIPSQLSALEPTWSLIYGQPMSDEFSARIVTMLANYYHYLENLAQIPICAMRLPMAQLVGDLERSIEACLAHAELPMTAAFRRALDSHLLRAKRYTSVHKYSVNDIFDWSDLQDQFPRQFLEQRSVRLML